MEQGTAILIDQIPLGILTFSHNGRVEFINQNFHKLGLLYQFNTSLLNINIFKYNLFPPVNIIEDLKNILKGKSFEQEIKHIKTNGGKYISLLVKGSPIYEDENISGGMLIIQDLQIHPETSDELKQQLDLTEDFIHKGEIFLIVTDINGDIKYSAGKEYKGLNLVRKEITGKNISEIFNSPVKEKIIAAFSVAAQYGETQSLRLESQNSDGTFKFHFTIEPVIGENAYVQILYLIFKEILWEEADIKSMQEKLQKLQYYEKIYEKNFTGFILTDSDGCIIHWDDQFEILSEIKKEEGYKSVNDIFPSLTTEEFSRIIQQLDESNSCELITNIQSKSAGKIAVSLNFFKVSTDDSKIILVCTKLRTDSPVFKQGELKPTELIEKPGKLPEPMCKIDRVGSIIFTNQDFNSLLGFYDKELYGENLFEFLFTEKNDKILEEITNLKTGERKFFPATIRNKTNTKINVNLIFEIAKTINDEPLYFHCIIDRDYRIESKEPEDVYQSIFNTAKNAVAIELNTNLVFANDSFSKLFGYAGTEELENKSIYELVSQDESSKLQEHLNIKRTARQFDERIELLGRKKDGSVFSAEFYFIEFEDNQQIHSIIIVRDITERKRAQEATKDSEQKYRNIADNIDDLLYTFERSGNKLLPSFYSAAIEKITGFTQVEFLSDSRLFLKIIHPDDFHEIKKRLAFLWKSDKQTASEFEFRIINKSGNIVWVRNKINVIRDPEGQIQKVYGLISDITFNKRAEEELKQSAANLKKLNDAKDRFLSIISHDLRAPFSSILGFTDLLLEDDTLSETEKQQYITYIQESSRSMLTLVNSMLDWTRLQTGRIKFEPEKINARELIDSSISTVSGTALKKGVEIENLVDQSYHLFADKNLILQAFNNLLSNAVKFTKSGDRITIMVDSSSAARFVSFSVKDTGIGIKPGNIEKLFSIETKFTSEGTAGEKGSGLGLSLVKEIIEKHGGKISVKSEYGKGTEFIFTLPVASTKILLVDPNSRERLFYSKVLINITTDYAVNVVSNGREALERINISPPALVITEHKMPVMSGYTLVNELIKSGLKETVPVIILTNDIDRTAIQEYTELGIEYVFIKPVNLKSFKEAIERSLKKRT